LQVFSGFSGPDMNFRNSGTSVSLRCSSLVYLPFHLALSYDPVLGRNYLPHVSFQRASEPIIIRREASLPNTQPQLRFELFLDLSRNIRDASRAPCICGF
jgi:hypothetical protein